MDPKALGNEPASPVAGATETVQVNPAQQEGYTKREDIAKALMAGFVAASSGWVDLQDMKEIARRSVIGADALLAELAKDGRP